MSPRRFAPDAIDGWRTDKQNLIFRLAGRRNVCKCQTVWDHLISPFFLPCSTPPAKIAPAFKTFLNTIISRAIPPQPVQRTAVPGATLDCQEISNVSPQPRTKNRAHAWRLRNDHRFCFSCSLSLSPSFRPAVIWL